MKYIIEILFGVRVEGEPAGYPEKQEVPVRPLDPGFFNWCNEFKVGCRAKNYSVFY
jgi:hypothetical protein